MLWYKKINCIDNMFFSIFFKSLNLTMSTLLHVSLLCQCCAWALMIQAACRNLSWAALLSELSSYLAFTPSWLWQVSGEYMEVRYLPGEMPDGVNWPLSFTQISEHRYYLLTMRTQKPANSSCTSTSQAQHANTKTNQSLGLQVH